MVPVQQRRGSPLLVRDVASVVEGTMPGEYDRYNMRRVVSMTANLNGIDLGHAAQQVEAAIRNAGRTAGGVIGRHPRPNRAPGADVSGGSVSAW